MKRLSLYILAICSFVVSYSQQYKSYALPELAEAKRNGVKVESLIIALSDCEGGKQWEYFNSIQKGDKLKELIVTNCELGTFPEKICLLDSLEYLQLTSCGIDTVYSCLGKLSHLKVVILSGNKIEDWRFIETCADVEELYLSSCGVIKVEEFKDLIHLKRLDLSNNKKIDGVGMLTLISTYMLELEYLNLSHCGLKKLPLNKLKGNNKLKELHLEGNKFKGKDQEAIRNTLPNCKIIFKGESTPVRY